MIHMKRLKCSLEMTDFKFDVISREHRHTFCGYQDILRDRRDPPAGQKSISDFELRIADLKEKRTDVG